MSIRLTFSDFRDLMPIFISVRLTLIFRAFLTASVERFSFDFTNCLYLLRLIHTTSHFRSVAERHRTVKFSHVLLNRDVHTDRNVSVTSQFRSVDVAERECLM
jgi:hypothetical protein